MKKLVHYFPIDKFEENTSRRLGIFVVAFSVCCFVIETIFYVDLGARKFSVLFVINLMFAALGGLFMCYRRAFSFHVRLWAESPTRRALIIYCALLFPVVVVVVICVILECISCAGIFIVCVGALIICLMWCCFVYKTCVPKEARDDIAAGGLLPSPEPPDDGEDESSVRDEIVAFSIQDDNAYRDDV